MLTRRKFLKLTAATGAGLTLPWTNLVPRALRAGRALAAIPGGSQNPKQIPKYVMPLVIPPAMPPSGPNYYEIAVRQFNQQILPAGMPMTPVWSYGSINHPGTFNYPAFTIETQADTPVRVKWINQLVGAGGAFLPHLLPVDPTLHWANPPGGTAGRDMAPMWMTTPGPYTGPVPMVPHLHGGHSREEFDGFPEAWFLPVAGNIPAGYATIGSWYDTFKAKFEAAHPGQTWDPGTATFEYFNDQRATTLWYHDHTLGMTRVNVYAGPAGFYLIRGGQNDLPAGALPGPAPGVGADPFGTYFEIPLAVQDRSFNHDGTLFYPDSRKFFDGINKYIPGSDVPPIWNPEFFGNTMLVNGRTWPRLTVQPRRYRLRFLNGCNSRFLILKMVTNPLAPRPAATTLPFWQIGTEGGFLPAPVQLSQLLMGPAERADVIVDFSGLPTGTQIFLINEGPDAPFGGGQINVDFFPSDPATTGQVMMFTVGTLLSQDTSVDPAVLALPGIKSLPSSALTRQVSLNEVMSMYFAGPIAALLGTLDAAGIGVAHKWMDPATETPRFGTTEVWEMHNFTADAHPIHLHQVMFQVVNRQVMGGPTRPPEAWETGFKDTVIAYPGEITRVRAKFDLRGLYVWHCHIVEHEDNEMMRRLVVG